MFRKTLLELQRKAGQHAATSSVARGFLLHEAATYTTLRPAASILQELTPVSSFSSRASWWPQSSSFAAQADQDQSAATSPESEANQAAAGESSEQDNPEQESSEPSNEVENETEPISYDELDPEELRAELLQRDTALAAQSAEIAQYKDRLIRTLADMENSRQRSAQQAENSKRFAVQGFARAMLDVADNLERAVGMVEGRSQNSEEIDLDKTAALLTSLHDGVKLTDKILLQAFKQNGIEQLDPINEPFDPNLHMALFEAPMPDVEPGTIHTVVKAGYTLNGRVLRAAEVGVTPAH
ncbi:hypothetical protein WJX74_002644 [Apatococcus lobatus]|uniref:GrpE protein homolog n=1 Tax=Apatococcus lobatus TaxID=904363 RepID=A0AAW1RBU7_9CHLO